MTARPLRPGDRVAWTCLTGTICVCTVVAISSHSLVLTEDDTDHGAVTIDADPLPPYVQRILPAAEVPRYTGPSGWRDVAELRATRLRNREQRATLRARSMTMATDRAESWDGMRTRHEREERAWLRAALAAHEWKAQRVALAHRIVLSTVQRSVARHPDLAAEYARKRTEQPRSVRQRVRATG